MSMPNWRNPAARHILLGAVLVSAPAWAIPSFSEAPVVRGDANFCVSKDDGAYAHPDCRVYYSCDRGLAAQVACPPGQVFDEAKNRDGDPGKSYCATPEAASHVDCGGLALKK